jgi:hypothetical protein
MKTRTALTFGVIILALLIVLGLTGAVALWRWVPAGRVAIVYNANAGVKRDRVLPPGRHVLGPLDQLISAPTQVIPAFYTQDPDYGDSRAPEGIQVTTRQGSTVIFDVLLLYRVRKEDIWKVFDNFARQPIEVIQSTRVRRDVKNVANTVGKEFYLEELVGAKRREANELLTRNLKDQLAPLGFTVISAEFVTAYPNDDQARQLLAIATADINREIAATNAQAAEKQKTIAITLAQAKKSAAELVAVSTTPTSLALQKLDIEKERLQRWNGSNVKIDTNGLNSLYVSPEVLRGGAK